MRFAFKALTLCVIAAVVFGGILFFGLPQNSHHTNFKYILWKHHLYPYEGGAAFLNVDYAFRESLIGKTKNEIKSWFPDLVTSEDGDSYQQRFSQYSAGKNYLWIKNSLWRFEFVDGKVTKIMLVKG